MNKLIHTFLMLIASLIGSAFCINYIVTNGWDGFIFFLSLLNGVTSFIMTTFLLRDIP